MKGNAMLTVVRSRRRPSARVLTTGLLAASVLCALLGTASAQGAGALALAPALSRPLLHARVRAPKLPQATGPAPEASPSPTPPLAPVRQSGGPGEAEGANTSAAATAQGCDGELVCGDAQQQPSARTSVVGWGRDSNGGLGAGYTGSAHGPVATLLSAGARQVVAAGSSYALMENGTVYAWGDNTFGELGNGSHQNSSVPVKVNGVSGAVAIAAGGLHAIALLNNGTVMTWGGNSYGQLGNGTGGGGREVGEANPVLVPGLSGVVAIAAGGADDAALLSNGTVEAWGENKSGQLGDGTTVEKDLPTPVKGLAGVKALAVGGDPSIGGHMLALLDNGTVMAVGGNFAGQLGNHGTAKASVTPRPAKGLSGGLPALSPGFRFSLALRAGKAFPWGADERRQLGQLSEGPAVPPLPLQVAEISEVSAISAGSNHSLALISESAPAPTLEVTPGADALTVHWLAGEEPQTWIVQWRSAGVHNKWSETVLLPAAARSYTVTGLSVQPYEVLVRNKNFGSKTITGTPLGS